VGKSINNILVSCDRESGRVGLGDKRKGGSDMLTPKQEAFVQNIIQGMSQADAYRSAYSCKNMSDNSVYVNASKLAADAKVALRLSELRNELAKPSIMSAQKRMEWLTDIVRNEKESTGDRLKAVDIMNKMSGEYVTKVEGSMNIAKLEDLI
jgi:phage terminase small subunit